jgi:intracellular sulfur oxidation DsrE/DsrF family protein
MSAKKLEQSIARRIFLGRLGVGAGVVGATMAGSSAAMAQMATNAPWRPAQHPLDDWYEKIPGQHRFVFDSITTDGMALALHFCDNYFAANQQAYGLKDSDLAVVVIARHKSTSFGYNDALWAKYGKQFSQQSGFTDPKTQEPPKVNVYGTAAGQMDVLIKRGVHLAVCGMSTRAMAGNIAKAVGGDADKIFEEISANLVGNARIVPAGILAVNRAQERGYSLVQSM